LKENSGYYTKAIIAILNEERDKEELMEKLGDCIQDDLSYR